MEKGAINKNARSRPNLSHPKNGIQVEEKSP